MSIVTKVWHGVYRSFSIFFKVLIMIPVIIGSLALNLLKSLLLFAITSTVWCILVGIPASLIELHHFNPFILLTSEYPKLSEIKYHSVWLVIAGIGMLILALYLLWFAFSQTYETWIKKAPYRYIPPMNYDSAPEHHQEEYHQDEVHDEPTEPIQSSEETPYDILGVSPTDDLETIKRVYRNLSKTYHPDVNSSQHAAEMTVKINNAWEKIQLEKASK